LGGVGSEAATSENEDSLRRTAVYGEYFGDVRNANAIEVLLGHRLRRPRLGVLIGRLAGIDAQAFDQAQTYQPGIRITTYDEILDEQKALAG
jgi:hypothetical protein